MHTGPPEGATGSLMRAGIYVRIIDDRTDQHAGVQRQEADCRQLAESRGWGVVAVYEDNDLSAYRGKERPAYLRLLEGLKAGEIDAVVVWHLDRLHCHPKELEEFFETCDGPGVGDLATVTGDVDLSTGDGRFQARILGAVARKESDDKSRRIRRKLLEAHCANAVLLELLNNRHLINNGSLGFFHPFIKGLGFRTSCHSSPKYSR